MSDQEQPVVESQPQQEPQAEPAPEQAAVDPTPAPEAAAAAAPAAAADAPVDNADEDEDGDYVAKNKELYKDKSFFTDEYLKCFDYPDVAILSCFCGCCIMGLNNSLIVGEDKRMINCLIGIFLGCCCCGIIRSEIQKTVGVEDDGIPWNCFMHLCVCCQACSLTQEYRSIIRWKKATDDKFKAKYSKKKYLWGNFDAYFP